ncbi:MAG: tetratricopeptide repeat protein [bacterium]
MKRIAGIFLLALALCAPIAIATAQQNKAEQMYQQALYEMEGKGDYAKAIESLKQLMTQFPKEKTTAAKALLNIGRCYEKLGSAEAHKAYERVVRDFADQAEIVAQARVRLAALGGPGGAGGLVTRRVLTDASGVDGILTPDGKYIRRLEQRTGDVVQFDVESGQTSRISNKGLQSKRLYYVEGYAFSRDGKQIAFDIETFDSTKKSWGNQLRIRNQDGSNLRILYSETAVQPFDWSPDAGSILSLRNVSGEANNQLVLIATADGSVRVLRNIAAAWYMLTKARFSPDGRYIAFSLVNEGRPAHGDLYVMTTDGRNEVVVAGHPAEDQLLDWTPDGNSLLFLSDRSGTWDIWTIRITGGKQQGEPELLKKDFGRYSQVLGFAPDGSLYYRTITPSGRLYFGEIDIETGKVLVPPAPVTTRYNGPPARISWSPNGRSLLYVSLGLAIGNGNNNLTIRSTETGEERFLSTSLRNVWDICWAPDSRTLLAWGMTVGGNAQFRVDAETGGITKLANGRWAPRISRDDKIMVFMAGGGIRRRNLDTGEESAIEKVGTSSYADVSPDGREIVFQKDSSIKIVSLNGGEPRELFRSLQYNVLRWTMDGRYIIAQALDNTTGRYAASSAIWMIPVQGGTPLRLDLNIPKMENFALHPDNRHFAFSVNEGAKNELWVMENFLPKEVREKK